MLLTEPHTVIWFTQSKDAYGTITASAEIPFNCFIEKRTRLGYNDNQVIEIGKGVIYTTTNSLAFDTGDRLIINNENYIIKSAHCAEGIDGVFSHWELTYG